MVIRVLRKGCGESWGIEFELWLPTEPMESVPSSLQTTHTCTGVGQIKGGGVGGTCAQRMGGVQQTAAEDGELLGVGAVLTRTHEGRFSSCSSGALSFVCISTSPMCPASSSTLCERE